jgi:hypothetical protein
MPHAGVHRMLGQQISNNVLRLHFLCGAIRIALSKNTGKDTQINIQAKSRKNKNVSSNYL